MGRRLHDGTEGQPPGGPPCADSPRQPRAHCHNRAGAGCPCRHGARLREQLLL